jgi:hypothetical protein
VAERTEREAEREQGDQDPSDAVDQGHAAGALDRLAATRAPEITACPRSVRR